MILSDREKKIYNMRTSGMTFAAIGKEVGVSGSRVSGLCMRATRYYELPDEFKGLPSKVERRLINGGIKTRAEAVEGINSRRIHVGFSYLFGKEAMDLLLAWLGMSPKPPVFKIPCASELRKASPKLLVRAIDLLRQYQTIIPDKEVRLLIEEYDKLHVAALNAMSSDSGGYVQ